MQYEAFLFMMSKAKLKSYSIDEKIKILKCLDQPGMERKSVREEYGFSESTQEKISRRTQANIKDYFKWNIEMVLY